MPSDQQKSPGANPARGYLYAFLAAVLWASSGTVGKYLFQQTSVTPLGLTQLRVLFATLILAGIFCFHNRQLFRIRWADCGYFILLGSFAMALVQGTYLYSISKIQVAAAILIQYLSPIFIMLYAVCFWKERLTLFKVTALVLALGGCYLVVGGYNLDFLRLNRLGIMAGLFSAFLFALYSLLGERGMHRYHPVTVLFYSLAFAVPTWHVLYPPFYFLRVDLSAVQWGLVLYIAVMGTIAPFGLYFMAVNHIRSTRASITATLEPIMAGFFAYFLVGEKLAGLQILGGIIVIGAIVLLQIKQERDHLAPASIRSEQDQNVF